MSPKRIFWNIEERRLRALWRLVLQAILFLILLLVFSIPLALVSGFEESMTQSMESLMDLPLDVLFPGMIAQAGAMIVAVYLTGRFLDRRAFFQFGLRFDRAWWRDLEAGLGIGAAAITVIFVVELSLGWIRISEWIYVDEPGWAFVPALLTMIGVFIAVGIGEELIFRGYQLRNIAEGLCSDLIGPRTATILALVLTSVGFSTLHLANPDAGLDSLLSLILAGLLLGLPFVLTGRLAMSIGLHITWNLFQGSVFGFPVSGMPVYATIIATESRGPEVWTGGEFGPEAGLMGLVGIGVCTVLILFVVRRRVGTIAIRPELAEYEPRKPRISTPETVA